MPNVLDENGLQIKTLPEVVEELNEGMKDIYGDDINLDPDTPDGQAINIFAQSVIDNLELIRAVHTSFDPDQAFGKVLDQRIAINGIQRQQGTHTVTDITIVTDRSVDLYGLDQSVEQVFTVQDNAGNQWQLISTQIGVSIGSHVYAFQALNPGATLTTPNTITSPVTIVLGVTGINNPTTLTTLGLNEEKDAQVKERRRKSVAISGQGWRDSLLAALENIPGVTFADVIENDSGDTVDGVPPHTIWVIVAYSNVDIEATEDEIANVIYRKRNAGVGMKGTITETVVQADGRIFTAKWDTVIPENLFIKITAASLDGIRDPNIEAIREGLGDLFIPGVNEQVNINDLATAVQEIDDNTLVTFPAGYGFSKTSGGAYTATLTPTLRNNQFVLAPANIIILPMILSPSTDEILVNAQLQMTALGGFGGVDYTKTSGGGSINLSTGMYTAPATPTVAVLRATDSLGNYAEATITVT